MPSYPFLFEVRHGEAKPGETIVSLPPQLATPNEVVVAKPEALALVAYLLSLDRTYPVLPAQATATTSGGTP
jgi:cytochrome c oxidase cbb3-type subunit 2